MAVGIAGAVSCNARLGKATDLTFDDLTQRASHSHLESMRCAGSFEFPVLRFRHRQPGAERFEESGGTSGSTIGGEVRATSNVCRTDDARDRAACHGRSDLFRIGHSATLRRVLVARPARFVAAILAGVGGLALAAPRADAGHNVFHIFTPAIEAGHQGFEALTGFNIGLPAADGVDGHGAVRAAHEIAYHRGVTDYWMSKIAFGIERENGEDYQLTSVASENVFRFNPAPSGPLDFGWFTAVSAGLASGESNSVEFGPIVSLSSGPVALVLNPFLEKTFGENREEGIAFAYAWRATYEIAERLSVGIEGYGEIENLGHAPPAAEQVHRIGPVLYLGHVHGARHAAEEVGHNAGHGHGAHESGVHGMEGHDGEAPDWHAEVGVLFGLTEATPDAALKVNIGADF